MTVAVATELQRTGRDWNHNLQVLGQTPRTTMFGESQH